MEHAFQLYSAQPHQNVLQMQETKKKSKSRRLVICPFYEVKSWHQQGRDESGEEYRLDV